MYIPIISEFNLPKKQYLAQALAGLYESRAAMSLMSAMDDNLVPENPAELGDCTIIQTPGFTSIQGQGAIERFANLDIGKGEDYANKALEYFYLANSPWILFRSIRKMQKEYNSQVKELEDLVGNSS